MKRGTPVTESSDLAEGLGGKPESRTQTRSSYAAPRRSRLFIHTCQAGVVFTLLCLWQWLPDIASVRAHAIFLDHSYIGSPSGIFVASFHLLAPTSSMWAALWTTIRATLIGLGIGIALGGGLGLYLSYHDFSSRVLRPFVVAGNATPLVALIPATAAILGPTVAASTLNATILIIFVVFLNAFEGGRSVRQEMIQNATLFGASKTQVALRVRLPYVAGWTFAAVPNAVTLGLIGAVATEFLLGVPGMGQLLVLGESERQPDLTFAIAVILALAGGAIVWLATGLRRRVLRWWEYT